MKGIDPLFFGADPQFWLDEAKYQEEIDMKNAVFNLEERPVQFKMMRVGGTRENTLIDKGQEKLMKSQFKSEIQM